MRHITTEAIILHKANYGEGDELVFALSKELGKIKIVAKGSKKIKSKFLGHLSTLNICKIQLYQTHYNLTLTECETITPFRYESMSDEQQQCALKIAAICQKYLDEQEDKQLYQLTKNSILQIQDHPKPFLVLTKFKISLIKLLGYFSDIAHSCPSCLEEMNENENNFINDNQHIVCRQCTTQNNSPYTNIQSEILPAHYRKFLKAIEQYNGQQLSKIRVQEHEKRILDMLANSYLEYR